MHLSQPGWEDVFASITIYQQGWRLGGKGASGRGEPYRRIEEHGLHIWFGCYHNAFRMLGRCYDELGAAEAAGLPRWPLAFKTMHESFLPWRDLTATDHDGCRWKLWEADFFNADDRVPWDDADGYADPNMLSYVSASLWLAADVAWSLLEPRVQAHIAADDPYLDPPRVAAAIADSPAAAAASRLLRAAGDALDALPDDALGDGALEHLVLAAIGLALGAVEEVGDTLMYEYPDPSRESDAVRRAWYVIDLLLAITRGAIADGLIEHDDLTRIDHLDFRDWLVKHGAARESADCVRIRALLYDLPFAYVDGDAERPAFAAGTALRTLLRLFFDCTGAFIWKMNAGMGDTVFAPLYELLVARGVEVRFFHRVEKMNYLDGQIETIEIDLQAVVPDGTPPSAFLDDGLWPADPRPTMPWLDPAIAPAAYESWYLGRKASFVSTLTLRRGAPSDHGFELVVCGLPLPCVANVAPDLVAARPRWQAAVAHVRTTPTQALQLWLMRPTELLCDLPAGAVAGGYVEPFDTWSDMPQLVAQENVPGSVSVAYFCNVAPQPALLPPRGPDAAPWLDEQTALVQARSIRFLRADVDVLWPHAIDQVTGEFDWVTGEFDWELLAAADGVTGIDRLDAQYWRVNVEPSELYTLSVPGSGAYRIRPEDTGVANLYAAGDWTACLLDLGCVEAAVISGMPAANGIHQSLGVPERVQSIVGWGP